MTLLMPTDVGGNDDAIERVRERLATMTKPTVLVKDGESSDIQLAPHDIDSIAETIGACRIVYLLQPAFAGCIAAFDANETLRRARLRYLVADGSGDRVADELAFFTRGIFATVQWIDDITIPASFRSSARLDLIFSDEDPCHVRLQEHGHRPQSSRSWRNLG